MIRVKEIKDYWINTPERFSEQYETTKNFISPTKAFLHSRRKKVLALAGDVKGKKILDVGCGSGVFMIEFAKKGADVVGIDYSGIMLDIAKRELKRHQVPKDKYNILKADATKLPFAKSEFDIVLATGLADYLSASQNKLFIKEVARVMKKDGILICGFPVRESPVAFLRSGVGLWVRKKFMKLPPIQSWFSIEEIRSLLREGNLKDVKQDKVFYTMWIILAKKIK